MASLRKNNLAERYLLDYTNTIFFFTLHKFHKTAKFVSGLYGYLYNIDKSYETLKRAKNPLGCIHFVRMAADACCYAYGLLMAIDDEHRKKYLDHILSGKPLRDLKTGLTFVDQDGKKKHQKYTTNFLAKEITKHLMPEFMGIYDTSNGYIHPSGFYFKDGVDSDLSFSYYENGNLEHLLEADINFVQYNKDVAKRFHYLMHALNQLFVDIMEYLKGTYEREYLAERDKQFPLTLNYEISPMQLEDGSLQRNAEGEIEQVWNFYTTADVVWELIQKYESNPEAIINQIKELVLNSGLEKWEVVYINVALEVLVNKETYKAQILALEDREATEINHQITQTNIDKGQLAHLDFLFPGKKLRKKQSTTTQPTFEGL